jgi:hypothetical protein
VYVFGRVGQGVKRKGFWCIMDIDCFQNNM